FDLGPPETDCFEPRRHLAPSLLLDYYPAPDSEACSTLHREDPGFLSHFPASVASRSAPGFDESVSASPVPTLWAAAILSPASASRKPEPSGVAAAPFSPRAHEPSRMTERSERSSA